MWLRLGVFVSTLAQGWLGYVSSHGKWSTIISNICQYLLSRKKRTTNAIIKDSTNTIWHLDQLKHVELMRQLECYGVEVSRQVREGRWSDTISKICDFFTPAYSINIGASLHDKATTPTQLG